MRSVTNTIHCVSARMLLRVFVANEALRVAIKPSPYSVAALARRKVNVEKESYDSEGKAERKAKL